MTSETIDASGDPDIIHCTLEDDPVAGTHQIKVRDSCGEFDASAVGVEIIPLVINSVTPDTSLSNLGG